MYFPGITEELWIGVKKREKSGPYLQTGTGSPIVYGSPMFKQGGEPNEHDKLSVMCLSAVPSVGFKLNNKNCV